MADVVVGFRGDTSKLPGDVNRATGIFNTAFAKIGGAAATTGKGVGGPIAKGIGTATVALDKFGNAFNKFGGDSTKIVGTLTGGLKNLVEGFAVGGIAGLGMAAAFQAIGFAADKVAEMKQNAAGLEVLNKRFGVTESTVRAVAEALDDVGISADTAAAQGVIKLGKEAKLTTTQITAAAGKIKEAMDAAGDDDIAAAADAVFKKMVGTSTTVADNLRKLAQEKRGIVALDAEAAKGEENVAAHEQEALDKRSEIAQKKHELAMGEQRVREMSARGDFGDVPEQVEANRKALAHIRAMESELPLLEKAATNARDALAGYNKTLMTERMGKFSTAVKETTGKIKDQNKELADVRAAAAFRVAIEAAELANDQQAAALARHAQKIHELRAALAAGKIGVDAFKIAVDSADEVLRRAWDSADFERLKEASEFTARAFNRIAGDGDLFAKSLRNTMKAIEEVKTIQDRPDLSAEEKWSRSLTVLQEATDAGAEIEEQAHNRRREWTDREALAEAELADDQLRQIELTAEAEKRALTSIANMKRRTGRELLEEMNLIDRVAERKAHEFQKGKFRDAQDFENETTAMLLATGKDRVAVVEAQHKVEMEGLRRLHEDKAITIEAYNRRYAALETKRGFDVAQAREAELTEAMQFGTQLGNAMIQGVQEAQHGDKAKAMARMWLRLMGTVLKFIPGAQAFAPAFDMMAGAFAEGGEVPTARTAGTDNAVAMVRGGEFVSDPGTSQRFGAGFFRGLAGGVVDMNAAARAGAKVMGAQMSSPSANVNFSQSNNFNGTLMHRDILMRELGPALRQMMIDNVHTAIRQLGLNPSTVAGRG